MDRISVDKLKALQSLVGDISAEAAMARQQISPLGRVALAKGELHRRRLRDKIFLPAEIFNDPAWEILLELYIADAEGTKLTASSICIEARVPQTTIVRWLSLLERMNFVQRKPDHTDKRRQWLNLTNLSRDLINRYFSI
ncbi:winged helix DNA-binding protein [Novosphingobium sp. PASSN1]|uniref:winged helix DNA-binding protein n=1 Tax=Novosphingobium sp. PASSN1 TaxID=2015561 RepID=UPI0025DB5307|nr:winged helix DNA-binding protein [Novosphingobium sp. PASSN1]